MGQVRLSRKLFNSAIYLDERIRQALVPYSSWPIVLAVRTQLQAFLSKADQLLFGGAAGGGKTSLGLGLALTAHRRTLFVRREGLQLTPVIDDIAAILGSREGYWRWLVDASRADLLEAAADSSKSCDFMSQKKRELFDLDRSLHQYLLDRGIRFNPPQLISLIVAADPPRSDEMIIEKAAKLSNSVWSAQRVAADNMRFKATHAISHLVWRLQLADCSDRQATTPAQAHIFGRWRTQRTGFGEGVWTTVTSRAKRLTWIC